MTVQFIPTPTDGTIRAIRTRTRCYELCRICNLTIRSWEVCVIGGSFSFERGYISGYFHLSCWQNVNRMENGKVLNDLFRGVSSDEDEEVVTPKEISVSDEGITQIPLPLPEFQDISELLPTRDEAWTSVSEILDTKILIEDFDSIHTRYGQAYVITAKKGDDEIFVITHSKVLMEQLALIKEQLPAYGTIKKVGNYYTF